MHEIYNSKFLKWYNKSDYFDDLTKFASLGAWIINNIGGEVKDLEELIGEAPSLEDDRELNDQDLELIKWCEENGKDYKVTNKGIKISA